MTKIKLQDKPIIIGTPIEIEDAVNAIRLELAKLPWIEKAFFIAQRFFRIENGTTFYFPETYAPEMTKKIKDSDNQNNYNDYARLTPDNDLTGSFFFLVGTGSNDYNPGQDNFLTYPVSIVFSVNLELIDKQRLENGLFTQNLMSEARKLLTKSQIPLGLDFTLTSETRDINEVYREFSLQDLDTYNRAPMQCFRFDLSVTVEENCI